MIKIYTDGSCIGNPGNGGWAAIIIENGKKTQIKGSKKNTTNNQMELLAPIKALKKIPKGSKVQIFTDSKYVKSGITEWIHNWKKNGWKTANKKEVKNKELWTELDNLSNTFEIKWSWVKAHSTDKLNNEVDLLARSSATSQVHLTKAIGAEVDRNSKGMGIRSNRYAMVIQNLEVINIQVEKETKQCGLSSTEGVLDLL